jgi:tyrosine decarboxylase/aspartate 1-decarboxylase
MKKVRNEREFFWPLKGQSEKEVFKDLRKALEENIDYCGEKDCIIGFPGTRVDPVAVKAVKMFIGFHPNNICTHTDNQESERGFQGTQRLEKDFIFSLGNLLGSNRVDGYITPGGTESNIMGLLLARETMASSSPEIDKYSVVTSVFTHYSIRKAVWVLRMGRDCWKKCDKCSFFRTPVKHFYEESSRGEGVALVGTDDAGRVLISKIEEKVREKYLKGVTRFIIVVSEGNIMTGAIDDSEAVGGLIKKLKQELENAKFYLHVDAAFGGFVVPFLYPDRKFSFFVPEVDSVGLDPHKMGMAPYPAGAFLYRKDSRNFRKYLGVQMGYVPGETDGTLCGSRSGASAAACYALMKVKGYEGYKKVINSCMRNTHYLRGRLGEIDEVELIHSDMNIVAFRLRGLGQKELSEELIDRVKLVSHTFPKDFSNPRDHVERLYKATVMPHVTPKKIDKFVRLLKQDLRT